MPKKMYQRNSVSYKVEEPLILESGDTLQNLRIQYTTYGEMNNDKSNVVWVFHALTGNSDPFEWWPGLIGDDDYINPKDYFIICANMLGSCYGSSEPTNFDFPLITIRDMVKAHKILQNHLGIRGIKIGIGGSMGGQQLLQWASEEPDLFKVIVPVSTNAKHSAWGIAFNEAQRMALSNKDKDAGIRAARAIAMLSYRTYDTYCNSQEDKDGRIDDFSAASYQQYQGLKLSKRFSPWSYHYLSKAMDSHNVESKNELSKIKSRAIVIGVESDILFPISEQKFIADNISNSSLYAIQSLYGHDGFLLETSQITSILKKELQ